MAHDLTAELDGYRNELARAVRLGRDEHADAVRDEMTRTIASIEAEAARQIAVAEKHEEEGRDIPAAQARVRARELRRAFAAESAVPAGETATDSTPRETATTKKKGA